MTVKSRGSILYFSSDSSWAFGVFKGPQLLFTADRCKGWREQRGEGGGGGPDPSYALRAGLPPSVAVWQAPLMDFYSTHKAKFCHIPSLGRKGKDSTSSLQL